MESPRRFSGEFIFPFSNPILSKVIKKKSDVLFITLTECHLPCLKGVNIRKTTSFIFIPLYNWKIYLHLHRIKL